MNSKQIINRSILFLSSILLFGGCSKTVNVTTLNPPKIDRDIRHIVIYPIKNDRYGVTEKLESRLSSIEIDGDKWFVIVNSDDRDKILEEYKLQQSGLNEDKNRVEIGNISNASDIITGSIAIVDIRDSDYYRERTDCRDKKCKDLYKYSVLCTKRDAIMSIQFKIVDISSGDIVFSKTYKENGGWNHCSDRYNSLPTYGDIIDRLSNKIIDKFIYDIAPQYITYKIELMDNIDISLDSKDKKLFNEAIDYIENRKYENAKKILGKLSDKYNNSYVIAYDLALLYELSGYYDIALSLYKKAYNIHSDVNIERSIDRVKRVISFRKKREE